MLSVGDRAPDFSLPDQNGATHTLSAERGKWVLVYFYPKDDTPGCTKEACGLRDSSPDFKTFDATVFGISADSVESHKKFADRYHLPFTVLADTGRSMYKAYGLSWWARASFLIDPEGMVARVYPRVNPKTHAEEVLSDLKKARRVSQKEVPGT